MIFQDYSLLIPNTSTTGQLTPQFLKYFDGSPQIIRLYPNQTYGPYYRIDSENWAMTIKDMNCEEEKGRWFGNIKPKSKAEARSLYHLPESNLCEYVYTIMLHIPDEATNCVLFYGKVANGNAIQYNLNNNGVRFVKVEIIGELEKLD
jgi:hypothetical protein